MCTYMCVYVCMIYVCMYVCMYVCILCTIKKEINCKIVFFQLQVVQRDKMKLVRASSNFSAMIVNIIH